jgi:hypothetical protein
MTLSLTDEAWSHVERTRILLVDLPRMLLEILAEALEKQPDMAAVVSAHLRVEQPDLSEIDVVITGHDDPQLASLLLERYPRLRLFSLVRDGKDSLLYELRPQRVPLGELSTSDLIEAIRDGRQAHGSTGPATKKR